MNFVAAISEWSKLKQILYINKSLNDPIIRSIDQMFLKLNDWCLTKKSDETSSTKEQRIFSNTNIKHWIHIQSKLFLIIITVPIFDDTTKRWKFFFLFRVSHRTIFTNLKRTLFIRVSFTCCENFHTPFISTIDSMAFKP